MLFQKKSDFLVCRDSDGTVMDTRTIKHYNCFGPSFVDVYAIQDHKEEILKEWNRINLFSITRGINRFQGLNDILDYVGKFGYSYSGKESFASWVKTTKELSPRALKEYREANEKDNLCRKLALQWSDEVNRRISLLPLGQPFAPVKEIISQIKDEVDLVGVSSANEGAVTEEWKGAGIYSLFRFVACQSVGKKDRIIQKALECGYEKDNTVRLGDALGDIEASKANGVHFFPILPGKETESWEEFYKEGLPHLLSHTFTLEYQEQLYKKFFDCLK